MQCNNNHNKPRTFCLPKLKLFFDILDFKVLGSDAIQFWCHMIGIFAFAFFGGGKSGDLTQDNVSKSCTFYQKWTFL